MSLYDPNDHEYLEPTTARGERDRTFQVCSDCRICVRLCPSFRSLFELIDANEDGAHDVRVLTDAEHDRVVGECYQCKLCFVVCPYTPERQQEWVIDFPRLMLRSLAIQHVQAKVPTSARLLARTDLQGKMATTFAPIVNRVTHVGPARTVMEKVSGIARERLLPTFAKVRFSKWFRSREAAPVAEPRSSVALFPTCLVEYQDPDIGKATVGVYERNRVACELPDGEICCGMPWLDAGDVDKFREHARHNVDVLAPFVRQGKDVVVPQPTCAYVLKKEYPDFLDSDDARLVGEHTFDTSEYLMARHREEPLDTDFDGTTYDRILWQAACHYRAQQIGPKSKQLMELTGADVTMVERCAAIDGTWGLRAENLEMAKRVAKPLMDKVKESTDDLVVGDCHLANTAIREDTDKTPSHPMQVMAHAYGVEDAQHAVRKLTVDDIADHRAYERERDEFRRHIIDLKRRRRIPLGELLSIVFENTDTMRWQVQEMARAERMLSDDAIAGEIATYNELIPDDGELSGTLFVELTDDDSLREWLPKFVGIQHHVHFELGDGARVDAVPEGEERLTRDDVAATVHYLKFRFSPEEQPRFAAGPARLVVDHPDYGVIVPLTDEQRVELARDFAG